MEFFESIDPDIREKQQKHLNSINNKDKRRLEALIYSRVNASALYYDKADILISMESFQNYLADLREYGSNKIANHFESEGFEKSRSAITYLRYVNEVNDVRIEKFIKSKLGESLYNEYLSIL